MHWKPVRKYYAKRWRERAAKMRSLSPLTPLLKGAAKKVFVTLELNRRIHERV